MLAKTGAAILALSLGLSPTASAKAPVQVEGCPVVSYFHGATLPHAAKRGEDGATWLTWADNSLKVAVKPLTLDQLAKRWKMSPEDLVTALCDEAGTTCAVGVVTMSNDGFADARALAIPAPTDKGATPRFLIHENACVDWEKDRVATYCRAYQVGGFAHLTYTVSGDEDEGEGEDDDLVWDQLFDAKTGKLLLTTSDAQTPGVRETPGVTVSKDGGACCTRQSGRDDRHVDLRRPQGHQGG